MPRLRISSRRIGALVAMLAILVVEAAPRIRF